MTAMRNFAIKDFELGSTATISAQGVAEAMFDYLPWPTLNVEITYDGSKGWMVIDKQTDFKYAVTPVAA